MLGIQDIEKLSKLARIELSEAEKEGLLKEIDPILDYVGTLKEVVGTMGEERRVPLHRNIARPDEHPYETGVHTDAIVDNFPDAQDSYLKVKKIL